MFGNTLRSSSAFHISIEIIVEKTKLGSAYLRASSNVEPRLKNRLPIIFVDGPEDGFNFLALDPKLNF